MKRKQKVYFELLALVIRCNKCIWIFYTIFYKRVKFSKWSKWKTQESWHAFYRMMKNIVWKYNFVMDMIFHRMIHSTRNDWSGLVKREKEKKENNYKTQFHIYSEHSWCYIFMFIELNLCLSTFQQFINVEQWNGNEQSKIFFALCRCFLVIIVVYYAYRFAISIQKHKHTDDDDSLSFPIFAVCPSYRCQVWYFLGQIQH